MIKVNSKIESGKWFTHPDNETIQFKIKPTSIYSLKKAPGDDIEITMPDIVDMYVYSLVDWKGIDNEDGKPLKCNYDSKMAFLNQYDELAAFVITKAGEMKKELSEALASKNLPESQSGETPKKEKPVAKTV